MDTKLAGSPEERVIAVKNSITHWEQMREWVTLNASLQERPSMKLMLEAHQQNWGSRFCALCRLAGDRCQVCPLSLRHEQCACSKSAYILVVESATWALWIAAVDAGMLPVLRETLDWVKGYNKGELECSRAFGNRVQAYTPHAVRQQAIDDSISHWSRMIADVQLYGNLADPPDREYMKTRIGEAWYADCCALCRVVNHDCVYCILTNMTGEACSCLNSAFEKVDRAPTWGAWLVAAGNMRAVLRRAKLWEAGFSVATGQDKDAAVPEALKESNTDKSKDVSVPLPVRGRCTWKRATYCRHNDCTTTEVGRCILAPSILGCEYMEPISDARLRGRLIKVITARGVIASEHLQVATSEWTLDAVTTALDQMTKDAVICKEAWVLSGAVTVTVYRMPAVKSESKATDHALA